MGLRAVSVSVAVLLFGCARHSSNSGYRQLTFDVGETNSPAISPDGKFVAYSSDRAQPGNLDIWIQQMDNGVPVRLTADPARDYDPVFAGDGKSVYFTSLRAPNGIYRVAVTGGAAQLVARGAVAPQVSPNGQTLLFVENSGNLAVMRSGDAAAHPLLKDFFNSYAPKWSPDNREILFTGKAASNQDIDWWVVPQDGSQPRKTGLVAALKNRGFSEVYAQAWLPGDEIVFDGKRQDQITLWRMHLSPDRTQIVGDPVRATDTDAGDSHAANAGGCLVFERTRVVLNLWALPADVNHGTTTGPPYRLTSTEAQKGSATIASDGQSLVYSADREGTYRMVIKDMARGTEKIIGPSSNAFYSVLNQDGSRYYFGSGAKGMIDVFTRGVSGWQSWWSSSVCDRCGMPRGISNDGKFLLLWDDSDTTGHIDLLELASGKSQPVLKNLSSKIYGPELAPDGKWISFIAQTGEHTWRAYIASMSSTAATNQSDWIPVTPILDGFLMAFWSPDGNLLYLLNEHGEGNLNWLDAQKLQPENKQPLGPPFAVYRFREPRIPGMDPIWNHPAVGAGKIVLELGEPSTNLWLRCGAR